MAAPLEEQSEHPDSSVRILLDNPESLDKQAVRIGVDMLVYAGVVAVTGGWLIPLLAMAGFDAAVTQIRRRNYRRAMKRFDDYIDAKVQSKSSSSDQEVERSNG